MENDPKVPIGLVGNLRGQCIDAEMLRQIFNDRISQAGQPERYTTSLPTYQPKAAYLEGKLVHKTHTSLGTQPYSNESVKAGRQEA